MEKLKALLTSKKFWTLVAAIVAALTAFFTTSCTGYLKLQREGVHHDTVKYEQVIKNKNYSAWLSNQIGLSSWRRPMMSSVCSSGTVFLSQNTGVTISSYLISPPRIHSALPLILSTSIDSVSFITLNRNCSGQTIPLSTLNFPKRISSSVCLALMMIGVPLSRVSPPSLDERRRGGRKGRPRPKIRNIPIGGSHL
jgi:hypothetical protein